MTDQLTQTVLRLCAAIFAICFFAGVWSHSSFAQEIQFKDRIGSNKDFDMCENFRFKRITKLVKDGEISQQQGFNIWKRIQSDKETVKKILGANDISFKLYALYLRRILAFCFAVKTHYETPPSAEESAGASPATSAGSSGPPTRRSSRSMKILTSS